MSATSLASKEQTASNGLPSSSLTSVPAALPDKVREQLHHLASSMVDNIFAKAIVRASQQLAFGATPQNNNSCQRHQARSMSICSSIELIDHTTSPCSSSSSFSSTHLNNRAQHSHRSHSIQLQRPPVIAGPSLHKQTSIPAAVSLSSSSGPADKAPTSRQPESQFALGCIEEYETSSSQPDPSSSRAPRQVGAINEKSGNIREIRSRQQPPPTTLTLDDGSGNPPQIQIDYAGPRTPSPIEESKIELKFILKQYKFKVDYDQKSIMEMDEESEDERQEHSEMKVQVNPLAHRDVPTVSIMTPTKSMGNCLQYDVANSPVLEMDITQAQQISKHIVADVIQQAREKLTSDIQLESALKREGESFSHISCRSGQANNGHGSCVWLVCIRDTLRRVMRSACFCGQGDKSSPTLANVNENFV